MKSIIDIIIGRYSKSKGKIRFNICSRSIELCTLAYMHNISVYRSNSVIIIIICIKAGDR